MSVRVEFRWSEELVARVEAAKGVGQPRADFVRRAVERELVRAKSERSALAAARAIVERPEGYSEGVVETAREAVGRAAAEEFRGPLESLLSDSLRVAEAQRDLEARCGLPPGVVEQASERLESDTPDRAASAPPAPAEQPYRQHVPGPSVENIRSSSQSKRDVRPVPKGER